MVRAEVRQIQIDTAVVVEVAGGDAHPVVSRVDPALRGHVGEVQLARAVGSLSEREGACRGTRRKTIR